MAQSQFLNRVLRMPLASAQLSFRKAFAIVLTLKVKQFRKYALPPTPIGRTKGAEIGSRPKIIAKLFNLDGPNDRKYLPKRPLREGEMDSKGLIQELVGRHKMPVQIPHKKAAHHNR